MFCPKCGMQNAENNQFCRSCGAALVTQPVSQEGTPQNTAYPEQEYQYEVPQPTPQPVYREEAPQNAMYQNQPYQFTVSPPKPKAPYSRNPVLNAVKTLGASPLFLVAAIAFTACLLFQFLAALSITSSGILGTIYSYAETMGLSYYLDEAYGAVQGAATAFTILGMIPSILVAVGIWMTFTSAINRTSDGMKASGLTIIKVVNVIQMVSFNILLGILEIVLIAATAEVADSYMAEGATTVFVVMILLVAGIDVFLNLYYGKLIKTVNAMKMTIYSGNPSLNVSSFVAVMCFISAFFSLFGLFGAGGFFGVMQVLAAITASVCFGVFLFRYKNKMLTFISPTQQTGYQEFQIN